MANIFLNKVEPKPSSTPEQLVEFALSNLQEYVVHYNLQRLSRQQHQNHQPKEKLENDKITENSIDEGSITNTNAKLDTMLLSSNFSSSSSPTSAEGELQKRLNQMKIMLYGDGKTNIIDEGKTIELAKYAIHYDLMSILIQHIEILPFEARKDTAHIFNNFVRKNIYDFPIYIHNHYEAILFQLVKCYGNPDSALSCGSMLRECIRFDELANLLLYSEYLWCFFDDYVHLRNFEIASDSFNTLRDLLTTPKNKIISSTFLHNNYDQVMIHYYKLLQSDNFVTRWRSLKLLGDLLLDRNNFAVMIRYITSKENLKTIMNMLRDKSPNIQFEAFHVFKVFVANPNKPADIALVLYKNKEKLISFLDNFYTDREDAQFNEEKCLLIETLSNMVKPVAPIIATPVAPTTPMPTSNSTVGISAVTQSPSDIALIPSVLCLETNSSVGK